MCYKYGIIKFHQEKVHVSFSNKSLLCLLARITESLGDQLLALKALRQYFQTLDSTTCNANLINTQQGLSS